MQNIREYRPKQTVDAIEAHRLKTIENRKAQAKAARDAQNALAKESPKEKLSDTCIICGEKNASFRINVGSLMFLCEKHFDIIYDVVAKTIAEEVEKAKLVVAEEKR